MQEVYCFSPAPVEARPLRLLVLGDSLSLGFMLPEQAAFPYVLARRLHADGYGSVLVVNGAIAGDTTADGLQRLPGALQYGADLVIVELGGNDMLNETDPRTTFDNIDNIIRICKAEDARVILAGMLSLPKFGPAYKATFDAIYPTLAAKHKIPRYPFFLQGVFGHPRLMLSDGKHPNAAGVRRFVAGILAIVETNLMGARSRVHASSHRATRTRHLRSWGNPDEEEIKAEIAAPAALKEKRSRRPAGAPSASGKSSARAHRLNQCLALATYAAVRRCTNLAKS
jgi:acyl-CoA thioesterase I